MVQWKGRGPSKPEDAGSNPAEGTVRTAKQILDDVMRLLSRADRVKGQSIGPSTAFEGNDLVEYKRLRREYEKLALSKPN